jgi:hypothetical protein
MSNGNGNNQGSAAVNSGSPYTDGLPPRGRIIRAFPPMVPPVLPDGRVPLLRFLGRFNALALPGGAATCIVRPNEARVALILQNTGTGAVYVSDASDLDANRGMVVPPATGTVASTLQFVWPIAPMGALFAVADAAHDLRVSEIFYALPTDWLTTAETGDEVGGTGDE